MVKNPPAKVGGIRDSGFNPQVGKGMVTHVSILTWRIPRTEEPGKQQSMESQRIGYNWSN